MDTESSETVMDQGGGTRDPAHHRPEWKRCVCLRLRPALGTYGMWCPLLTGWQEQGSRGSSHTQLGVPPTRVSEAGETDETRQGDQMGIRGEEGGCLRWTL